MSEGIETLLREEDRFEPRADVAARALVGDYERHYRRVIGKPDPIKGEAIKAFVLLRAGITPSDALRTELVEHVRRVLGPIAAPAELEFAAKLPKTRSGSSVSIRAT